MYYLFIIHKGGRVQELECGQGGGTRQGAGWTMEQSYVDNEEVVTEKPQTTWLGRGLPFYP